MEAGFVEATSQNLPVVDADMIFEFCRSNPNFQDPEVKNVKTTKATRETYGDQAIGYVQIKRTNSICIVKARITPEHKIHQSGYRLIAQIDEEENIVQNCECLDCSASAGGCKHSLAFLLWLHRRSEEPSVTSVQCYWNKPKLAKIGTTLKYSTLSDICRRPIPSLITVGDDFLKKVLQQGKEAGSQGTLFQSVMKPDTISKVCLHSLSLAYSKENRDNTVDDFLNFVSSSISGLCGLVAKETTAQSKSSKWYVVRYGRITASKLFEASRCRTYDGELVKTILGGTRPIQTDAIKRGQELEETVKKVFEKSYNITVEDAGFFLNKKYPVFGASPDGLTSTHVIEIKCPSKAKTIRNYVSEDGVIEPKPKAQMHLQMLLSKRKFGYFIVAAPDFEKTNNFHVYEEEIDEEYIKNIMCEAEIFWKNGIYPKL